MALIWFDLDLIWLGFGRIWFDFIRILGWIWAGFAWISASIWILGCIRISLVVAFHTFAIF